MSKDINGAKNPNWKGGIWKGHRRIYEPLHSEADRFGHVYAHRLIAEKALGKTLPSGVVVHHHNENKQDNRNKNLVICENEGYHKLLHIRMRAYKATGNANARKCTFCKKWGMETLRDSQGYHYHKKCRSDYATQKGRERREAKRTGLKGGE